MKHNSIDILRQKASALPLCPGVYLMKNAAGRVIYVGKSRKLRQRVLTYFTGTGHTTKTARMVSLVDDFDYIVCDSEIEALGLENTLIKKYSPRYNIKLKDAKSYPYIAVTAGPYPRILVTRERKANGARYYGPYAGTTEAYENAKTVNRLFRLPTCHHSFPEQTGKVRPCLYRQMHACLAPCVPDTTREVYLEAVKGAEEVLSGNVRQAAEALRQKMFYFSELEQFEAAAGCRDALSALGKLGETQKVLSDSSVEQDVWAMAADDFGGALALLAIRHGSLNRKNEFSFSAAEILDEEQALSFLSRYYTERADIPKEILLSFHPEAEGVEALADFLSTQKGKKVSVTLPLRGEKHVLCDMAAKNAVETLAKHKENAIREETTLVSLASLLGLEVLPERIEVYDISNIGKEYTTAGMIVYADGKLRRNEYRTFRIRGAVQDDYAAMREALTRRLSHKQDEEKFGLFPDLILLDGGKGHVATGKQVMQELGLSIPIFGLVKDDFHKTRALTDEVNEISVARDGAVYSFLYRLQEEVHRRAVGATMGAKRKSLRRSSLEDIPGIGHERAKLLLSAFGTLGRIKTAPKQELATIKGLTKENVEAIYAHFHPQQPNEKKETSCGS